MQRFFALKRQYLHNRKVCDLRKKRYRLSESQVILKNVMKTKLLRFKDK